MINHFAAIAAILSGQRGSSDEYGQLIASAYYGYPFSRSQLVEQVMHAWLDAIQANVGLGKRSSGTWRRCVRLNLRPTDLYPRASVEEARSVDKDAVIYLFDDQQSLKWLTPPEFVPLDEVPQSEWTKAGLTDEQAKALAPYYERVGGRQ